MCKITDIKACFLKKKLFTNDDVVLIIVRPVNFRYFSLIQWLFKKQQQLIMLKVFFMQLYQNLPEKRDETMFTRLSGQK